MEDQQQHQIDLHRHRHPGEEDDPPSPSSRSSSPASRSSSSGDDDDCGVERRLGGRHTQQPELEPGARAIDRRRTDGMNGRVHCAATASVPGREMAPLVASHPASEPLLAGLARSNTRSAFPAGGLSQEGSVQGQHQDNSARVGDARQSLAHDAKPRKAFGLCCKCCVVFTLVWLAGAGITWWLFSAQIEYWWRNRNPVLGPYDPFQHGLRYMGARCNSLSADGCNPYQLPMASITSSFDPHLLLRVTASDMTPDMTSYTESETTLTVDKSASRNSQTCSANFGLGADGEKRFHILSADLWVCMCSLRP
eukprot:COSAG02_NODE_10269_length_1982_cov_1.808816_2_plen_309_part_00